ncbi:MAG: protocatechuate 3,4-dioxygenase subunit alpha [Pseudomonadota bacterium]
MKETASQTAGPYLHIGLLPNVAGLPMYNGTDPGAALVTGPTDAARITLTLRIFDGAGDAVTDAMVEIWQADGAGHIPSQDADFTGWGRATADPETGLIRFETVKPGPVAGQAPHVTLWIAARGINLALHTRAYFAGDDGQDTDPVLSRIDPPARRETLMARQDGDTWHLDIRLQGDAETVFLDI